MAKIKKIKNKIRGGKVSAALIERNTKEKNIQLRNIHMR